MRPENGAGTGPASDWLDGCTGFVVESDAGRIGRLAEIRHDPESGRPTALVVHAGMVGWRELVIPVGDVAGVLPGSGRVVLNGSYSSSGDAEVSARPAR